MRTVEVVAHNRGQAVRWARGFDCPAVESFASDWEENGSCRFIGTSSDGDEVSVLIVAAARPGRSLQWEPTPNSEST